MKCEHPGCTNTAIHNLCHGHREIMNNPKYSAAICFNCLRLVSVFEAPADYKMKYVFVEKCRNCGGTIEDEKRIFKKLGKE